jgi:hypothetical protein
MESKHGDFWGHVMAVINDAHDECAKMFMDGKLDEFEKTWLDRKGGKVTKLTEHAWFADAKPIPRKIASESIRREVKDMVEYYRWAKKALSSD